MIRQRHIPNALTISRFIAVPLLLGAWYLPATMNAWAMVAVLMLASVTDFLDGYLARRWGVQSELGRLLDPNADKLLIATALILLCADGLAHPVAVTLILCRELFVSALREYMAARNITLHATFLAKCKTTVQMLAVIALSLAMALQHELAITAGQLLLWLAMALTLITGYEYWQKTYEHIRAE